MFYGREMELGSLESLYKHSKAQLVAIYGRRRVGKSTLIKHFSAGKPSLFFEGLERETSPAQVKHAAAVLKRQVSDNVLMQKADISDWTDFFDILNEYLLANKKQRTVIVFDEFQWMAAGQAKLVALLKYYWDNFWKDQNVLIILCGSIASFMVKKVIRSKALYGRLSFGMHVGKLLPHDVRSMLKRRGEDEVLKYQMILGGVPRYLEFVDQSKSFEQNIEKLFFSADAPLGDEFEKIFFSHFKEPKTYARIVRELSGAAKSLQQISETLKMPSGGGLSSYLENLLLAGFIGLETPFLAKEGTKLKRYRIVDELLLFYVKYLRPNEKAIANGLGQAVFRNKIVKQWEPWLGLAFESFCRNQAPVLASAMGFADCVVSYGAAFSRASPGFQIDLLFERADGVITLCEIKYHQKPIGCWIIPEVKRKAALFSVPRGKTLEFALISPHGADESLHQTEFFHHIVTGSDIFRTKTSK
jgi:AAA+ ATPase superfamily predicted ATPase